MITNLFNAFLYIPILNVLVVIYNSIAFQDLGIAIILTTILIRIILFPLFHKSTKHQMVVQKLQPHIKEIQRVHKKDKEKQTKEILALYKEHNVNPFSSFGILLIQLPIIIALYQLFRNGIMTQDLTNLYSFVAQPGVIDHFFLGLINLQKTSILIVGLAAAAQYVQGRLSLPKIQEGQQLSQAEKITRNMVFLGPVITIVILPTLPAAIGLYWLTTTVFSAFQQLLIKRMINKDNGEHREDNQKIS